jgi:hypothetical protein
MSEARSHTCTTRPALELGIAGRPICDPLDAESTEHGPVVPITRARTDEMALSPASDVSFLSCLSASPQPQVF